MGLLLSALYWTVSNALEQQVEASIRAEMDGLVATYQTESPQDLYREIIEKSSISPMRGGVYFLARDGLSMHAGNVAISGRAEGWQTLPASEIVLAGGGSGNAEPDEDHRVMGLGKRLPDGSYLFVGGDAFRLLSVQESILVAFAWTAAIGIILACLGGILVGRRALSKVDLITSTTRAIMSGKLKQRIALRGTSDELDRLSSSLNEMLDRIQALMENLKHISSDIAHDLRTPLSHLRQSLESSLVHATTTEDFRAAVEQALAETDRLLEIFSALLRISDIESGTQRAAFVPVSLSNVFIKIADAYGPAVEESGRPLLRDIKAGISIRGDFQLLVQMLGNIVANAIAHTPTGTAITIALSRGANGLFAGSVADNGPGIAESERTRVWQRFYRTNDSRSSAGNGLGLSLVRAIADLHHIRIRLVDNEPGLRVELETDEGFEGEFYK